MDYSSIKGKDLPDYAKRVKWNVWNAYIDAHSQRLIEECPVNIVQPISRLQSQCENMTFSDQSRFNRLFQKVIHKGG